MNNFYILHAVLLITILLLIIIGIPYDQNKDKY